MDETSQRRTEAIEAILEKVRAEFRVTLQNLNLNSAESVEERSMQERVERLVEKDELLKTSP
tara:strand:- start:133 stop:318 length:186 start_codon:yes stop_codon:yes gene_type:complete